MTYPSLADFFDYEIAALIVQTVRKHSINWEAGTLMVTFPLFPGLDT